MSPRRPAVLRDGGDQDLRQYLIATAARMIGEAGGAGLAVRDIARQAHVADGVLYNYFEDKEDLLAHALLAHVGSVMHDMAPMPEPGSATVAENLRDFIDLGLAVLTRIMPAFAGLRSQPKVLTRFHAMVGGDPAFGLEEAAAPPGSPGAPAPEGTAAGPAAEGSAGRTGGHRRERGPGERGLPETLTAYLRAEQELGRIAAGADVEGASMLITGAMHGQVLPRLLLGPPGASVSLPPGLASRLAAVVLSGIAPASAGGG
jgi:AcrR family transcriptional regulator